MFFSSTKTKMPSPEAALPGRDEAMPVPPSHHVLGTPLKGPFAGNLEEAVFGLGCFWGAEKQFWRIEGVHTTAVGYAAGFDQEPDVPRGVLRAAPGTTRWCGWFSIPRS